MAEPITIPISVFELTVLYEKPVISLLTPDHAGVVQSLFDAFAEYKPNVDDMEVISAGKNSEQGIRLHLASLGVTLFFGATNCRFTKDAAAWQDVDKMMSILDQFLAILTKVSGVALGKKKSILSLHLQPKAASFKDILRPFMDTRIQKLDAAPLDAMALVARWGGRRLTFDGSARLANGIYLSMEREFEAAESLETIRQRVLDDEIELFELLGVEANA